MATLQGKAVKNTYRQVLQIGANNVGVSGSLQPVQDGAGVNTALSLSTLAATVNGDLTITGDLIITGGGIEIKELIDDTVAALIKNGTGITWTYNDGAASLTGNFTGTTSVVPEGSNLYYTQGRFDSAFAAKSTTNLAEGSNLYFTAARGNANFATNLAASDTDDLTEGATNLYFTNARARTALSVTAGTGLSYNNTTGVFNLAAIPNASLTNSSITINGQAVSLGGSVTLTTTNIGEGTNLYWTEARGNANFTTNLAASSTTNLAEGTNLYYTQARFDTAFSNKSTTNLAEGTNLYYTQARFNSALAAKTTTDLAEGTNLYYTDARSRLALSSSATGLTYANNSGVFSLTAGYAIPTTVKLGQYDIAYNRSIVSAAVTGTSTKTLSLTQQDANVITATWTDQGITTINGTANQIAATTVGNTTTLAFTNDVTMPNNLVVSGNLTINGTATYVNTESISSKDPLFEVANTNNTTDAVDIGYYGRYYDAVQERVEFTGLFRDASDAGKFKIFTGLVDEPTNVVNTTGTGYTVATLVANVDGNLNGTANAANILSTARTIAASGDATWSVSFNGSANVTSALTLSNTGVTATTYGTSTAVPTIAVDSKGRITSASNTNITFPVTTVNGFAGTVVLTTSDVAEGTNQYFTTGRVSAYLTGAISTVLTTDLTASRAVASNASGKLVSSGTTDTELGYLSGVTSAVQTQLNSKLNLSGGTLTGGLSGTTGTFSGILTTPQVKAATSAGLSINANSGTQVADFGAGGSANITFFGGLSGTSATFSSSVTATGIIRANNSGAAGSILSSTMSFADGYRATLQLNNTHTGGNNWELYSTNNSDGVYGGGKLGFRNTTTDNYAMTITSGGNVGIGTTSPLGKLDVFGGAANTESYIRTNSFDGTYYAALSFSTGGQGANDPQAQIRAVGANNYSANLVFYTQQTGTVNPLIRRAAIKSTGEFEVGYVNSSNDAMIFKWNGASSYGSIQTFSSSALALNPAGNTVLVGTTTDTGVGKLQVRDAAFEVINSYYWLFNTGNSSRYGLLNNGSGALVLNTFGVGNVGSFNMTTGIYTPLSDVNKKKDFEASTIGLKEVLQLKPTLYRMKSEDESSNKELGFIAQEVKEFIPQAYVESGEEDTKFIGLNFNAITAGNTKAIQELYELALTQQVQIEELKAMITAK
jgi:hypothetical protein